VISVATHVICLAFLANVSSSRWLQACILALLACPALHFLVLANYEKCKATPESKTEFNKVYAFTQMAVILATFFPLWEVVESLYEEVRFKRTNLEEVTREEMR